MPKYKTKTKECQLIVRAKLSSGEIVNERELDFFQRKYIRGLLKATYIKKFMFTGIEYTGPVGISLLERLKKIVTKYDFYFVMEQVADMVHKLQNNGLSINKIDWDIHNVFINETTREMQFIYLPLEKRNQNVDILAFMESIIYSANVSAEQNTDYISEFTYFLKGLKEFDADKIENFIQIRDRSIVNTIKKHSVGQSGFAVRDKSKKYNNNYDEDDYKTESLEEEATALLADDNETWSINEDDETGLLEDEGDTVSLNAYYSVHYPSLLRVMTGEVIFINKPVFRLGKEKSYSDYFVSNNSAVSRSHADIITRGHRYFVIDLNSKNKTHINDQPLTVQVETEIKDGDVLRLANEEFVFKV